MIIRWGETHILRGRKSNNYCCCNSLKNDNYKESETEKRHKTILKISANILRATNINIANLEENNYMGSNREKSIIVTAILKRKKHKFVHLILFSPLLCSQSHTKGELLNLTMKSGRRN